MSLFFVGIIEMVVITSWTKLVSDSRVISSGIITTINIFIWYYVLRVIVDNIDNWLLVLPYAAGCAAGTMATTYYFMIKERRHSIAASSELKN